MYRIVAIESRRPRDGRFLEILGHYNPLTSPATVVVKEERVRRWLHTGAQPTETVARLLRHVGVEIPGRESPAMASALPPVANAAVKAPRRRTAVTSQQPMAVAVEVPNEEPSAESELESTVPSAPVQEDPEGTAPESEQPKTTRRRSSAQS
jgi:small subunit ribosomal protein S16